ncbi:MAG: gluconokinase [Cyanobacteria bacterium J06626_18]
MGEDLGYVVGIDIGTTSTKSILFRKNGAVVYQSAVGYPLHSPVPDAAEQDPEEIFRAVIETIRQVVREVDVAAIAGLSFSAAMHSLILMDTTHQPLTASITWADNRSAKWATDLKSSDQGQKLYRRTGTPVHPMSPLVKLIWLRQEHPELFNRATRFISIKEYVFYRLFERYVVDYSIASATGLLNLEALNWDAEALSLAGIGAEQLSELVPTTQVLQGMRSHWATQMGLATNIPVVIGANDGALANLGVGAVMPGTVAVTVGTSGAVRAIVDRPQTDPDGVLFCYALTPYHWVTGGAVNNGGIALRWLRDQFADTADPPQALGQDSYDQLMNLARTIRPGADGLIFHPYLAGERSPLWDANASASFVGLSLHHTRAHMVRAVLEGVIYNLHLVFETLQETIGETDSICAAGGFAQSDLWRQMLADIFNCEVTIPQSYESSCLGAAILGLFALGYISDLKIAANMLGTTQQHQPIAANVAQYQKVIPVYQRLLNIFKSEYVALTQLREGLS